MLAALFGASDLKVCADVSVASGPFARSLRGKRRAPAPPAFLEGSNMHPHRTTILAFISGALVGTLISVALFVWHPSPDLTVTVRNDTTRIIVVQSENRNYVVQSRSSIQIPPPESRPDPRGWVAWAWVDHVEDYAIVGVWVNTDGSSDDRPLHDASADSVYVSPWGPLEVNSVAVSLPCGTISMWTGVSQQSISPVPARHQAACTP
jgi:hypothetical protein